MTSDTITTPLTSSFDSSPSFEQEISEIHQLYNNAEKHIKEVERHANNLPIPAINELRYAGQHLLRSLTITDNTLKREEYKKSANHCRRATYDAIEILVLDYLINIKNFQDQFQNIELAPSIPDYHDKIKTIREVKEFITTTADAESKARYYLKCEEHLKIVKPIWHSFEDAKDEIIKRERKEKRNSLYAVIGIVIAGVTLVFKVILPSLK